MIRSIPVGIYASIAAWLLALTPAACDHPEGAGTVSVLKAKEIAAEKGIKTGPSGDEVQPRKKKGGARPTTALPKGGR